MSRRTLSAVTLLPDPIRRPGRALRPARCRDRRRRRPSRRRLRCRSRSGGRGSESSSAWSQSCCHRSREYSFGSNASRTASPMKTTSSSVTNRTPSGIEDQPPLGQVLHSLADQLAPARRRRGQAEAQEVERDERADVGDDHERRKRDDRRQRVRQDVPEHDRRLGHAGRDRGADVVLRLLPVELAAHVIRDSHPVERPPE